MVLDKSYPFKKYYRNMKYKSFLRAVIRNIIESNDRLKKEDGHGQYVKMYEDPSNLKV